MEIQEIRRLLADGKGEPEAQPQPGPKPEEKPGPKPEEKPGPKPEEKPEAPRPGRLVGNAINEFIFAGNAIFTIRNPKTGNRYTYRIRRADDKGNGKPVPYFVSVLTGSNNDEDYSYIGFIRPYTGRAHHGFFIYGGSKARVAQDAQSVKAFEWFFSHIAVLGPVEVFHEGRCGRCGRTLTVPESIERGIGPECEKMRSKNNLS